LLSTHSVHPSKMTTHNDLSRLRSSDSRPSHAAYSQRETRLINPSRSEGDGWPGSRF
jgi:hypothetical protein